VAAVVDLFSRRVVGWSMHAAMTAQLVTDALVVGQKRRLDRRPVTSGLPREADIFSTHRHVSKVPNPEVAAQTKSRPKAALNSNFGSGLHGHQRWLRLPTIRHEANAREAEDHHGPGGGFGDGGRERHAGHSARDEGFVTKAGMVSVVDKT
jgi:hypothetical protein